MMFRDRTQQLPTLVLKLNFTTLNSSVTSERSLFLLRRSSGKLRSRLSVRFGMYERCKLFGVRWVCERPKLKLPCLQRSSLSPAPGSCLCSAPTRRSCKQLHFTRSTSLNEHPMLSKHHKTLLFESLVVCLCTAGTPAFRKSPAELTMKRRRTEFAEERAAKKAKAAAQLTEPEVLGCYFGTSTPLTSGERGVACSAARGSMLYTCEGNSLALGLWLTRIRSGDMPSQGE